jgi:hypothetical protein
VLLMRIKQYSWLLIARFYSLTKFGDWFTQIRSRMADFDSLLLTLSSTENLPPRCSNL